MKIVKKEKKDKELIDKEAKLKYKIKCMALDITKLEKDSSEMKKVIARMKLALGAHINRQFAEIRVVEEDGKWGDWSGVFYASDEDTKRIVLKKARKHYDKYFKNGIYCDDKQLGLFLSTARSGKQLVEQFQID